MKSPPEKADLDSTSHHRHVGAEVFSYLRGPERGGQIVRAYISGGDSYALSLRLPEVMRRDGKWMAVPGLSVLRRPLFPRGEVFPSLEEAIARAEQARLERNWPLGPLPQDWENGL